MPFCPPLKRCSSAHSKCLVVGTSPRCRQTARAPAAVARSILAVPCATAQRRSVSSEELNNASAGRPKGECWIGAGKWTDQIPSVLTSASPIISFVTMWLTSMPPKPSLRAVKAKSSSCAKRCCIHIVDSASRESASLSLDDREARAEMVGVFMGCQSPAQGACQSLAALPDFERNAGIRRHPRGACRN